MESDALMWDFSEVGFFHLLLSHGLVKSISPAKATLIAIHNILYILRIHKERDNDLMILHLTAAESIVMECY